MEARDLAYSPPARAIAVVLRTAHIATMAMLVGGMQFAAPEQALRPWRLWTVATGAALLVTEVSHSRHWVYQGRGVAALAHVGVLALVFASSGMRRWVVLVALVIGSVGSHLPKRLRKWSLRHGRVVE